MSEIQQRIERMCQTNPSRYAVFGLLAKTAKNESELIQIELKILQVGIRYAIHAHSSGRRHICEESY